MPGPLEGVFVLDLTRALAGPYGTLLLADLGAEVVKVEAPADDETLGAAGDTYEGMRLSYLANQRNKKRITIDARTPEGKAKMWELVDKADIVYENFRPGVMERLGFGFEALQKRKPAIVLASLSGFGQDGPFAMRPAFDAVVQAMSGGMSMTGHPGQPPARSGLPIGDTCAGMSATLGAVAALYHARQTGKGAHVDVSMLEVLISLGSYYMAHWLMLGQIMGPQGNGHPSVATYRAFQCGDGKWVQMTANTQEMWKGVCKAFGLTIVDDPRFATGKARYQNKEALWAILEPAFAALPAHDAYELLEKHDVPIAEVLSTKEALENEHIIARGLVQEIVSPSGRPTKFVGPPFRFKGIEPVPIRWPDWYDPAEKAAKEKAEKEKRVAQ